MRSYKYLEERIHNSVDLSSKCLGEWCRSLESAMDEVVDELYDYLKAGVVDERFCLESINNEIRIG